MFVGTKKACVPILFAYGYLGNRDTYWITCMATNNYYLDVHFALIRFMYVFENTIWEI